MQNKLLGIMLFISSPIWALDLKLSNTQLTPSQKAVCDQARPVYVSSVIYGDKDIIADTKKVFEDACNGEYKINDSIRYTNSEYATHWAGRENNRYVYPNGQTISSSFGTYNDSWQYPNGNYATHWSGNVGAVWFYPDGKAMTYSAGWETGTWYNPDGTIYSYEGPKLTKEQLMNFNHPFFEEFLDQFAN